jgi:isopenicillin-N epimerase
MRGHGSRRSFLFEMAASTALLPSVLRASGEAAFPELVGESEIYWELVRAQFSFREEKVPMNAANLCPSPRAVAARVTELTLDIDRDCSSNNRAKFSDLTEATRVSVADQLGVSADEIALVRNTSEANNTINNGLALSANEEVIVWDQNHPTNNVAWDVRAARYGLVVRRVTTPKHPKNAQELIDVFVRAFRPSTKVLTITHVSNVSGIRLPVQEIVEAAHERGIYVHVDGAQSWGALDVNLRKIDCDSYAGSAHKWLMGPKEAGVLYVKSSNIERIWPNVVAPSWGRDVNPNVVGARKFESLGQRDDACLAAVGTTVDFHRAIGAARLEARMVNLATKLKHGIAELGIPIVTPMDAGLSGGVVVLAVAADRRTEVKNRLYEEHGIAGAVTGGLRLCPHAYNTADHVERAVEGVRAILA